jgi:hypothetical protein
MHVKPKLPAPQPNRKQKTTRTQKTKIQADLKEGNVKNQQPHKTKNKYKCQTDAVLYR